MSRNPDIHIFTSEALKAHERHIATKVHQATVTSTVRKLNKMNPGQTLHASRNNGESLYWPQDKIEKVLEFIEKDT